MYLRSLLHNLWMTITCVPYALVIVVIAPFASPDTVFAVARKWLALSMYSMRAICGIDWRISGQENLPTVDADGKQAPAILLVKHQSTLETFLMPTIMPRQLAYVFKKELLYIPFFGWAIGRCDMVHIDRSQGKQAFTKVVEQGRRLLNKGKWVIMFPEGTRKPRGVAGFYKTGGTRLAIEAGVPVVPIAVTSAKCWPKGLWVRRPGTVDVSIGPAISSTGREPDELMAQVQRWIETEMRRLDPEAYTRESAQDRAVALAEIKPAERSAAAQR